MNFALTLMDHRERGEKHATHNRLYRLLFVSSVVNSAIGRYEAPLSQKMNTMEQNTNGSHHDFCGCLEL